jgi:uncharacterized protein YgiM (DUF1202 family)
MLLADALLMVVLTLPLQDLVGDRKVNTKEAAFMKGPSRISGVHRKAEDGEDVTVIGVEGKYAKVTVKKDGATAYIIASALIEPEKFKRSAADEQESQRLVAQGLEGQKGLNPDTEKEYRSQGGASREQAYKEMEAWMARPSYKGDRSALEAKLKDFRQEGKLGEYSSVK